MAACVTLIAPASAQPQQVPDTTFDARVARPVLLRQRPRMLFDEAHHNVHRTETTYRAFADLVANDGARIEVNRSPFTRKSLAEHRLLVIAGPLGGPLDDEARAAKPAFSPAEIRAVRDWVRRGGGLLLLTDHEPVASASADLAAAFGVTPSRIVVVDRANRFPNFYPTNILATRANGLLRNHPLTCGVEKALVFGGQSLSFPPAAVVIGIGAAARTDKDAAVAGNGQMGAFRYGRGRIVITGDMGMLSAQMIVDGDTKTPWGMNVPGIENRQLLLNAVRWLAGHPTCGAKRH